GQPKAVGREDALVGKAEIGKKLHLRVFGKPRIRRKIHDAGDVHVGPLNLKPRFERSRAGRQRIAKAAHSVLLPSRAYRANGSASRFTRLPCGRLPSVVRAKVSGISA